jgi:hypothetical protein
MRGLYVRMREQFGAAEARRLAKQDIEHRARRQIHQVERQQRARVAREKAQAY